MLRRTTNAATTALVMTGCVGMFGCAEPEPMEPPPPETIADGAEVTYATIYESTAASGFGLNNRPWIPMDVTPGPAGQLWVIQRLERDPAYDDETECTSRSQAGSPNDCAALSGGTVAITDPAALEAASEANGRADLVVDFNSFHFMRRPAGIVFGAPEIRVESADPGAADPASGAPLAGEAFVFRDTFATCHEHRTGNFTDQPSFLGPSLWTADPAIYNGDNGANSWSNGSHLDMVHATEYCVGITWERDNVYWLFNGALGAIDRYDFVAPHVPGHSYHEDGLVARYDLADDALARVPNVPSNLVMAGAALYIADSGNGRVVRFDTAQPTELFGTFRTHEFLPADLHDGAVIETVASFETLELEWGAPPEPSGLAFLGEDLVVASHGTGHITLIAPDGTVLRTLDTGLGAGIGGLTVLDGVVYFTHMGSRSVHRVDVVAPPVEG